MNARNRLLVACLLAVAAGQAAAQSILERRYTSDKLEEFWQGTLGTVPPDTGWFEMLATGADPVAPVADAPAAVDVGVPFFGTIIGESAPEPDGTRTRRSFPVVPLPPEEAAILVRRLAWAELYLNRYRYFEPVSTDTAEVLSALTARQFSAGVEAYLILARFYYSAPDLQEKCARLSRLRAIETGPLAALEPDAPLAEWRPLVAIVAATRARLDTAALTTLVCSVAPVRTRGEMADIVTTRVRERIMREVRTKVDETLALLRAASSEFQALVNDMDVPIRSAEVMELERVLGNARANMLMVKEDQLRAAQTVETLRAVDLGSLNQPTELQEFESAQQQMAAMTVLIDAVLAALADLDRIAGDGDVLAELAPCASLRGAYPALDLSRDTGALAREISQPYEDCIARARTVVARFQNLTAEKLLMAELAARVRQISEAFLTGEGP